MSTVLEARGIGVAFAASLPILKDVSFVLGAGFHGLVGANGSGKTTLLRVLAGELSASEGTIRMRPDDAIVAYCPQDVDVLRDDIEALARSHDGLAAEIKGRLDLDDDEIARWPTLSPGERKRWQIGAALAREPDVLLLDEPTNHLDGDARDRLGHALARFRGTGILVSHDRLLLERLPRSILRVHNAHISMYAGAYSEAKRLWEAERLEREEAHASAKSVVRAAERRLDAARRAQESTSHSISSRSRIKDKNDHDGRSFDKKALAQWADARAGRTARVLRDEVTRLRDDVPAIERDNTLGDKVFVAYERAPHPNLFHLAVPQIRSEDDAVAILCDVRVTIAREDRVRVVGDNGAGKTTLLRALHTASHVTDEHMLYLPQELTQPVVDRMLRDLRALDDDRRGRVLSIFSALGSDPKRIGGSRLRRDELTLSPGEARKLALALGLGKHAWALVLDEPTNHLDLPTIERLEHALCSYPGCLIMVTHDDAFATRTLGAKERVLGVRDRTVH